MAYEFGAQLPFNAILSTSKWKFNSLHALSFEGFTSGQPLVSWQVSYKNLFNNAEWSSVDSSVVMNALTFGAAANLFGSGFLQVEFGGLFAFEDSSVALAPSVGASYWQSIRRDLTFGLRLTLPHNLNWKWLSDRNLRESTPLIAEATLLWSFFAFWDCSATLSYQGWNQVHYSREGESIKPASSSGRFELFGDLFARVSIHYRNRFFGGIHTESLHTRTKPYDALPVGVFFLGRTFQPFRLKKVAVNALFMDKALLRMFGFFPHNPREVSVRIGIESQF